MSRATTTAVPVVVVAHRRRFGPETAPRSAGGASGAAKAAGGGLAFAAVPIPARCPVTGARTCYTATGARTTTSEHDGRYSHPDALAAGIIGW